MPQVTVLWGVLEAQLYTGVCSWDQNGRMSLTVKQIMCRHWQAMCSHMMAFHTALCMWANVVQSTPPVVHEVLVSIVTGWTSITVCDIVEARCDNWQIDLDEHLCSRINQSIATDCRMFGHVCLRHVAKVSCNQLQLINWFWYVYANKINSTIYTVHIPRRQLLPSPLKAHTCSHTQQSLDIHCDCTQEDSRHCPQNVSVYTYLLTVL